jgi:hypothetical protein
VHNARTAGMVAVELARSVASAAGG